MCDRIYHFKTIGPRSIKSPVELIKWSAGTRARIDQILQINLELFYINSLYQRLITTNIFYRHEQSTQEESSQFAAQGEYKKIGYFQSSLIKRNFFCSLLTGHLFRLTIIIPPRLTFISFFLYLILYKELLSRTKRDKAGENFS